ncbi:hypothetical protein ONA70_24285 [Micromonospora yasonensis]|uniref:hypothetical protein n=1 Tax=Micromonospora yasonensis TaxID=1128667 RepID=UPI0022302B0E|nr:hypothetical protein [Micromonospora yasonensis]MCW3843225.1 hypothetical protein [Micromonospora yasonensis]
MAYRTWGKLLLAALGVSVLAGAGQLGIAYGFGVVRLDGDSVNRWPAQLAWVGWFAAVAAVAGAVLTERLARRDGFPGGTTEQLSVAGAAALGATVVAPLCMQPARAAELGGTVDPVWAVGICAILGAVVGAGASIAVLLKPPFGWNVVLTAAAVWLLALLSVAPAVASAGPLHTVRLGVLEPSWLDAGAAQGLAMLILPILALLAGAAVGALARRRGHLPLVGGAAGVAGPVLLAFAYLSAGPGDAADRYQLAPYYGALIAVAAGALGSTAATLVPRPASEPASDAIEPTDILQPLPPSPEIPATPAAETSALVTPASREGTDHEAARIAGERAGGPTRPAGRTPAHWDWPVPAGITPAPVPAGRAHRDEVAAGPDRRRADTVASAEPAPAGLAGDQGPDGPTRTGPAGDSGRNEPAPPGSSGDPGTGQPAPAHLVGDPDRNEPAPAGSSGDPDRDEPAPPGSSGDAGADEPPAAGRDAEDPIRALPMPGVLPPGRRTAAIDVLAAGRPVGPPAGHAPEAPTVAAEHLADPSPAERPEPAAALPAASTPAPQAESTPATAAPEPAPAGSLAPQAAPASATATPEPAPAESSGSSGSRAAKEVAGGPTEAPAVPRSRRQRSASAATRATSVAGAAPAEAPSPTKPEAADPARPETPAAGSPPADVPVTGAASAEAPAEAAPAPAEPRPAGRSKRPRKGRTSPAAAPAGAAGAAVAPEPADSADPPPPVEPPAAPAPVAGTPDSPAEDASDATDGRSDERRFFIDPEPVEADLRDPVDVPASPRPRFPIFEDVSDAPGSVRPAWPIAPAANRPVGPRGGAPEDVDPDGRTDNAAADTGPARVEPAPRPRHRALPDLDRGAAWDAFVTARQTSPTTPDFPQSTPDGRHAALAGSPPTADGQPTGEPATTSTDAAGEPGDGQAKQRRGLFRRNRAKTVEATEADREAESLAQDEEYVDWVAGLASDDADDAGTLRTGRHHRD